MTMISLWPHLRGWNVFQVSMGILSAFAVVWSGIETWSCSRRSGRVGIDHVTLGQLIVFACGNLANVFFLVVACASFHTFTFYKGQSVVQVLLPSHQQDLLVRSYVISAFSLKVSLSCTGHYECSAAENNSQQFTVSLYSRCE